MKKLFYLILLGFIVLWSCNSESDKNSSGNQGNDIVEVRSANENNQDQNNLGLATPEESAVKLDSKFSAFLAKFKKENLPYRIEPVLDLKFERIPFELQAEYLIKAEGLDRNELDQMQDFAKFYYLSNPVSTVKFNAIVYARSEMGSSYYILCNFDNNGKLISFIDFAMYQVIGAGPQAGQKYIMSGSIDKDLVITTVGDDKTLKYQIQEDGKIIKK